MLEATPPKQPPVSGVNVGVAPTVHLFCTLSLTCHWQWRLTVFAIQQGAFFSAQPRTINQQPFLGVVQGFFRKVSTTGKKWVFRNLGGKKSLKPYWMVPARSQIG